MDKRHPTRKPSRHKKPSTALAGRPTQAVTSSITVDQWRQLFNGKDDPRPALTEDIALGGLGLQELKLTKAAEKILDEPVPVDEVQVKPTGQPYLSHPAYTRWFNRAFGRTGWALVPASKPLKDTRSVVCPYVLHVHGKAVAFAIGEQDYFESNKEQTYGDALESTIASALRRCAKRLGIGLELWDRTWLAGFLHARCIRVNTEKGWKWRRKVDPPFYDELPFKAKGKSAAPAEPVPPAGHNPQEQEVITEAQVKRLWVIVRRSGRPDQIVKEWLQRRFKVSSSKLIKRADYEYICAMVESPATLPEEDLARTGPVRDLVYEPVRTRDPGQEG